MAQAAVAEGDAAFADYAAAVRAEAARRGLPLGPVDRYAAAATRPPPVGAPL
jgi:hypothetical protein